MLLEAELIDDHTAAITFTVRKCPYRVQINTFQTAHCRSYSGVLM